MEEEIKETISRLTEEIISIYSFENASQINDVVATLLAYLKRNNCNYQTSQELLRETGCNFTKIIVEVIFQLAKGKGFSAKTAENNYRVMKSIRIINHLLNQMPLQRRSLPVLEEEERSL